MADHHQPERELVTTRDRGGVDPASAPLLDHLAEALACEYLRLSANAGAGDKDGGTGDAALDTPEAGRGLR